MNRLKDLRKEKGLSQKAFSEEIGVSYRTIQNWENGESQIKPDKAQQLADYFGVSVGYLLGYDIRHPLVKEEIEELEKVLEDEALEKFQAFLQYLSDFDICLTDANTLLVFNTMMANDENASRNNQLYLSPLNFENKFQMRDDEEFVKNPNLFRFKKV